MPAADPLRTGPLTQAGARDIIGSTKKNYDNYIGDVRNPQSIRDAMPGVDYIFHAAALKQVPSCEFFPMQAVQTNIIGTDNVLHAAIDAGVKRVVCLSTDKAAYPINAIFTSRPARTATTIPYIVRTSQ